MVSRFLVLSGVLALVAAPLATAAQESPAAPDEAGGDSGAPPDDAVSTAAPDTVVDADAPDEAPESASPSAPATATPAQPPSPLQPAPMMSRHGPIVTKPAAAPPK